MSIGDEKLDALLVELRKMVPVPYANTEERALQALDFAYGNLAASTNHKPEYDAFKKIALERGLTLDVFERWAKQRKWWRGRMLALVPERPAAKLAEMRAFVVEQDGVREGFTCDTCTQKSTCVFAFDAYNTNGDCLAAK